MKSFSLLFCLIIGITNVPAQSGIFNVREIKIEKTYDEISPLGKYRYDSVSYTVAKEQTAYMYETFSYKSDEFEVEGYSCKPLNSEGKKLPVIIYNRGGTGNIGKLSEEDLPDFYWLAKYGFVVFASNYRFVGELGKVDQSGGDDVNDVINLFEAVQTLDFVDSENIFMMGVSRGGMMTYQSIRQVTVKAAAVIAGVADLRLQAEKRPIFITGWSDLDEEFNYEGLQNILPEFEKNRNQHFDKRSAVVWADEIKSPVYILHSRQDGRVPVDGALNLSLKLNELGKPYKLKIYDEKSHGLPYSKFDSFEEIIAWFKSHMT
ncbi:alpha/beta hydrolase family protein [Algoriphagus sediminis]|uniref:Prolyl oligopeptidase family serine peptidase n=1 Tax=Algoriphagus sediminis TaxID=3057113 RepID=A0ABT7YFQ3_9BACT|nr:prolyl oligopeptidase family serine peptidase [Algoriphagus sediminis]MDN3205355.1 prolyl oligopeptidase family serine peptidase [Algoriphagus sediminis]